MVSQKTLQALSRGRAIRRRNLKNLKQRKKIIRVPRNAQILNPAFFQNINSDLDVGKVDAQFNEKISANEGLFTNLDDVVPRALQGGR